MTDFIPVIDREPELRQLEICLDSALRGKPATALITGKSGTGKTYLSDVFLRIAEQKTRSLVAAATNGQPFIGRGSSHGAITEILAYLLGFDDGKNSRIQSTQDEVRLQELRGRLLSQLVGNERILTSILPALPTNLLARYGVETSRVQEWLDYLSKNQADLRDPVSPQAIHKSVLRLLQNVTEPLVIVFDDLQWIDSASLEIFLALPRALAGVPIMLMATA